MRLAFGVEYDGSQFYGWQCQDGVRTVQECVEQALSTVADRPVRTVCGGRTDTGVHGIGQVVHVDTDAERTPRSWVLGGNVNLPADVAIRWCRSVDERFHARYSALYRRYAYVIQNRMARLGVWSQHATWEPRELDSARMQRAAQHLVGEHDFSSYRARGCQAKHPVRTIEQIEVNRCGDFVIITVTANAFLQHMVRNIAGVLISIGSGRASQDWSLEVLQARDRSLGGVTAPPQGLYLMAIDYPAEFGLPKSVRQALVMASG